MSMTHKTLFEYLFPPWSPHRRLRPTWGGWIRGWPKQERRRPRAWDQTLGTCKFDICQRMGRTIKKLYVKTVQLRHNNYINYRWLIIINDDYWLWLTNWSYFINHNNDLTRSWGTIRPESCSWESGDEHRPPLQAACFRSTTPSEKLLRAPRTSSCGKISINIWLVDLILFRFFLT